MTISIGQALRRIKKLKGRIGEDEKRAKNSVYFEEGEDPAFSFATLREGICETRQNLVALQTVVAAANANNAIKIREKSYPLSWVIRELQEIKGEIASVKTLVGVKSKTNGVNEVREYKYIVALEKNIEEVIETKWTCVFTKTQQASALRKLEEKFEFLNDKLEYANNNTFVSVTDGEFSYVVPS